MAENDFMRVMKVIKEFLLKERVGNIQINCFKGGISSINVSETLNWRQEEKEARKGK